MIAGEHEPCRQQVIGLEAGLDLRQAVESPHHQPGAGEQHQRERGLDHHQAAAQPVRACREAGRAPANERVLAADP